MDKLKMHAPDLTQRNIDAIAELFPTVVTESIDADGNPVRAIDFDALRQELSDHLVEGQQERYQLDWPGKRAAAFAANAPIAKTLRPVREESVDFNSTKNLFIEGDNLEALKLLQESYLGKVRLIYIDPPYNTGNDFVYEDDFAESRADYLARSGQKSEMGDRLVANTEANGRFHSDWLSMIYPRIRLAKALLRPDGFMFISIDDHEYANLKRVCDEVLGSSNYVATFAWQKTLTRRNDATLVSTAHEYVLCYARDFTVGRFNRVGTDAKQRATYTNRDGDPRGDWLAVPFHAPNLRPNLTYPITTPSGRVLMPPSGRHWSTTKEKFEELLADGRIYFGKDGDGMAQRKKFWSEREEGMIPWTWWPHEEAGENRGATKEIKDLFGGEVVFSAPKPTKLIAKILELIPAGEDDILLDFFAGSGTSADAVLRWNATHPTKWRFIAVQLAEPLEPGSAAASLGLSSIAALCAERVRRAAAALHNGTIDLEENQDRGFRYLRADSESALSVLRSPDDLAQASLDELTDSVKPDRTDEDLLFQVLLDWGLDLAEPIVVEDIAARRVLSVADGALIACFADEVTEAVVREIANRRPLRAVFLDAGFATDAARINAEQIFREVSPETEVRAI
ncbi:site-specific DNA-methyltransferase [Ornithinibacter aureus]|uniref:Site-specific DNA-methyltransferase n=1 Tax=Ornithinibacter aureus TaxID=622664 RepID=A0ABP8JG96_9MICO|nr:site-specific DNA-methyltransferase [Ornithinibacter aureus]KAF0833844.1 adenine-specific DNA-methyltransferase [Ornithinibacter aureus]